MANQIEISNGLFINRSENDKIHEITMLYLKQQDLRKMSVSELAQKYSDTKIQLAKEFEDIYTQTTQYV